MSGFVVTLAYSPFPSPPSPASNQQSRLKRCHNPTFPRYTYHSFLARKKHTAYTYIQPPSHQNPSQLRPRRRACDPHNFASNTQDLDWITTSAKTEKKIIKKSENTASVGKGVCPRPVLRLHTPNPFMTDPVIFLKIPSQPPGTAAHSFRVGTRGAKVAPSSVFGTGGIVAALDNISNLRVGLNVASASRSSISALGAESHGDD